MFAFRTSLLSLGRKTLIAASASSLLVLVLGLGIGLGAASARANGDGTHYGCVNRTTGVLRIVASRQNCTRYEMPIQLSDGSSVFADYTRVKEFTSVRADDEAYEVEIYANCPEGYSIMSGGVSFTGGPGL